jgi:hypothetical protein
MQLLLSSGSCIKIFGFTSAEVDGSFWWLVIETWTWVWQSAPSSGYHILHMQFLEAQTLGHIYIYKYTASILPRPYMHLLSEPMTRELREVIKCRKEILNKSMVKVAISKQGKKSVGGSEKLWSNNATSEGIPPWSCEAILRQVVLFISVYNHLFFPGLNWEIAHWIRHTH